MQQIKVRSAVCRLGSNADVQAGVRCLQDRKRFDFGILREEGRGFTEVNLCVALDDPCHMKLSEATLPDLYYVHFCKAYNAHHLDS